MRSGTSRALATACLLGVALSGCGADAPEDPPSTSSSTTAESSPDESQEGNGTSQSPGSEEDRDAQEAVITIEDFAYSDPGPVAPGAEVTVENDDNTAHTVTADEAGGFDVTIAPGESATFTAPAGAGDYPFSCSFHANMHGTLVVE